MKTCIRGHERSPENLTANSSCRVCNRMHALASADRKRAAEGKEKRVVDPSIFPCGHVRSDENTRKSQNTCATCHREKQKARYRADPETHRQKASAYQFKNRAAATVRQREWRENNRERYNASRRIITRNKQLGSKDADTIEYLDIIANDPCVYCGNPSEHVDHILASARGGENHWTNYAPACAKCNQSKHAGGMLQFLLRRLEAPVV